MTKGGFPILRNHFGGGGQTKVLQSITIYWEGERGGGRAEESLQYYNGSLGLVTNVGVLGSL